MGISLFPPGASENNKKRHFERTMKCSFSSTVRTAACRRRQERSLLCFVSNATCLLVRLGIVSVGVEVKYSSSLCLEIEFGVRRAVRHSFVGLPAVPSGFRRGRGGFMTTPKDQSAAGFGRYSRSIYVRGVNYHGSMLLRVPILV